MNPTKKKADIYYWKTFYFAFLKIITGTSASPTSFRLIKVEVFLFPSHKSDVYKSSPFKLYNTRISRVFRITCAYMLHTGSLYQYMATI